MTQSPELHALLRTETGTFRAGERRRRFDPTLSVGVLAGERTSATFPLKQQEYLDRQVRWDFWAELLADAPEGTDSAWISRAEQPVATDDDIAWLVGAEQAFASLGMQLTGCYVITRYGWLDLRSGEQRVWKRLRINR